MSKNPEDAVEYRTPSKQFLRRRLQQMDPYDFEEFVADVWEYLDWETRVVGEPGDQGIDVIATNGERKQLIQAKRYGPNTTVGSPEVQQYASLRLQEDNVQQVTIVTTGEFSRQAEELAPDLDVILVDGEELLAVLEELEAFEVFVEHFESIELESTVDADTREESDESLLGRIQSWLR
jgi:restriction system protein